METAKAADIIEKLKNVRGAGVRFENNTVAYYACEFAEFLGEWLARIGYNTLTPERFLMEAELAFGALKIGTYPDGRMITHRATDRVPALEFFIRCEMPNIIDAVCSPDFAEAIKRTQSEVVDQALETIKRGKKRRVK